MSAFGENFGFPPVDMDSRERDDLAAAERQIEEQRPKWEAFIKSRGGLKAEQESWLWQYWRPASRSRSPVAKKFLAVASTFGIPSNRAAQRDLKKLIRKGVPPELRAEVWYACAGATQKKNNAPRGEQYNDLVARFNEINIDDSSHPKFAVADQIRRDIPRTFPTNSIISTEEGKERLRRVLGAYSERNPTLGYCQSMNFVAGSLLIFMEEENAFWTFAAIIEDILPKDYYTLNLLGCRVDQQMFTQCIKWKLPRIGEHLEATDCVLEPVTCSWFMSCFSSILPPRVVFRLWDCLLWEGNVALVRAGISLLRAKSEAVLACEDFMSIYMELKDVSHHVTALSVPLAASIGGAFERQSEACSEESSKSSTTALFGATHERCGEVAFIDVSFNKKYCGSYPRARINHIRDTYRKLIVEQDAKTREMELRERQRRKSLRESKKSLEAGVGIEQLSIGKSVEHSTEEAATILEDSDDDDVEIPGEGLSLRAVLEADSTAEHLANYAATKTKLEGADEIFHRVMSESCDDDDDDDDG